MRKLYVTLVALMMSSWISAQNVITIKDADLGSGTYTWTSANEYHLDGLVFLESGGTLNIQPGTVVKGIETPSGGDYTSALIITTGAKIHANGTAGSPVIFTSELDDTSDPDDLTKDERGLWGGLIILGNGILGNSSTTAQIEGIPTTEIRSFYGGNNNDDNSGSLSYVSIRHGGALIGSGNEINGLTLGGVGRQTQMHHIEVFANLDDGIEFFGGAVEIKHAVVAFCGDDSFDWDLGYVGKGQFWFSLQASDDGDCGGELDGAIPDDHSVYSNPTVYNATFIGSGASGATAPNSHALLFRDATAGTVANSIFTDFANKALQVEDLPSASGVDSYSRIGTDLNLKNNIWYGFGSNTTMDASGNGIIKVTTNADEADAATLIQHLNANNNQLTNPQIAGISRNADNGLDPRALATAVTSDLAGYPAGDSFFDQVSYKGAFDPQNSTWVKGWTALDEYGFFSATVGTPEISAAVIPEIYPNPAGPVVYVKIPGSGKASLVISDFTGKTISVVEGNASLQVNTSSFPSGVYFFTVETENIRTTHKVVIW